MDKIKLTTTTEYFKTQKSLVIDYKSFLEFAKSYKATNKNDTLTKMITRFFDAIKSKKLTNEDLNKFDYFTNLFVINDSDKQKIANIDKFTLKTNLIDLYKQTKRFGVIKTIENNNIIFDLGLKNPNGFKTLQTMYIMLLKSKLIQAKPPKKEKQKKTIKK